MTLKPLTEFALLSLKPGVDITSNHATDLFRSEIIATLKQQEGMTAVRWGHQMEEPRMVVMAIDWTDITLHQRFIASPPYAPFLKTLQENFTMAISVHHAFLPPEKMGLLGRAPCIEYATFFNISPAFLPNLALFEKRMIATGMYGMSYGVTLEEIVREREKGKEEKGKEEKGKEEKGKAVVLCIGWESREAHMVYRETENFRENIGLLRRENGGASVVHVKFME